MSCINLLAESNNNKKLQFKKLPVLISEIKLSISGDSIKNLMQIIRYLIIVYYLKYEFRESDMQNDF